MNDGVQSPEQAARSLGVVRLVSFGASAALAVLVLLGIAMLRYAPAWPEPEPPHIAVVSEIERETPPEQPRQTPPPPAPRRVAEPQEAPTPAPPQQVAAPSEPVVITDPVWIQRPRNPERFYPREAFMRGVAGEVVLDCEIDTEGRLACVVVSETPEGAGFGDAALRIAGGHVMRPATRGGAPVRARYRMVVPFSPGQ